MSSAISSLRRLFHSPSAYEVPLLESSAPEAKETPAGDDLDSFKVRFETHLSDYLDKFPTEKSFRFEGASYKFEEVSASSPYYLIPKHPNLVEAEFTACVDGKNYLVFKFQWPSLSQLTAPTHISYRTSLNDFAWGSVAKYAIKSIQSDKTSIESNYIERRLDLIYLAVRSSVDLMIHMHQSEITHGSLSLSNLRLNHKENRIVWDVNPDNLRSHRDTDIEHRATRQLNWELFNRHRAIDQWSLGVTIYQMITGEPPFEDLVYNYSMQKVHMEHKDKRLSYPIYYPPELRELTEALMFSGDPLTHECIKGMDFYTKSIRDLAAGYLKHVEKNPQIRHRTFTLKGEVALEANRMLDVSAKVHELRTSSTVRIVECKKHAICTYSLPSESVSSSVKTIIKTAMRIQLLLPPHPKLADLQNTHLRLMNRSSDSERVEESISVVDYIFKLPNRAVLFTDLVTDSPLKKCPRFTLSPFKDRDIRASLARKERDATKKFTKAISSLQASARELRQIINHLQSMGVIHGSLAPDQLIWSPSHGMQLGASKNLQLSENRSIGSVWGKSGLGSDPVYFDAYVPSDLYPPESSTKVLHNSSDLWGAGAMLHSLASGRVIYSAEDSVDAFLASDHFLPEYFPYEFRSFVRSLMKPIPHERLPISRWGLSGFLSMKPNDILETYRQSLNLDGTFKRGVSHE